jgi:hypothetical protein
VINLKTIGFFVLIALCGLVPTLLGQNKKYKKALDIYYAQSENAQPVYTGKVRDVFDPLDDAYKVSKELEDTIINKRPSFTEDSSSWPILSLWIDPQDLNSEERGIVTHGHKKGRLWERAGFVDYYKDNQRVFESFTGVRQHGGTSRNTSQTLKSFRLYFKKKYGESEFYQGENLSLGSKAKIKRLVVKRDIHLHFGNAISFFLINSLGGLAPNVEVIKFYINGKFYAYQMLTEHLSEEQLKYYWGHNDFYFSKIKGDQDIQSLVLYKKLRAQMESSSEMSFDYVTRLVDIDSVMASLLVIMYTGTTDWAQGLYTKEMEKDSKWKLISWDFDRAFYPVKNESFRQGMSHDYEMKSVGLGIDMKKGQVRWSIFNRLIQNDKKFREYFSKLVDKLFSKVLVGEEFQKFMNKVQRLVLADKDPKMTKDLVKIKEFIKYRKAVFCADLLDRVNLKPKSCQQ